MKNKYYITTPIYYPNDIPHLGHAYTTIAADVLARWNKLQGKEVFFLTGTDEHGKKLQNAAEKVGKKPKEFVDGIIPEFKEAWKKLNIEYNRFIRTTDKEHEKVVQAILQKCFDNGDIYKGDYEGLYCTSCEAYFTEKDCPDKLCPVHNKPLEYLKEESYFFKLSKYQKYLLDLYEKNPEFISPESKKQEIINRVKEGLKDFSISRTSFNWGIPLPFDKKHICYVWFDALLNYISGIDYLEDKKSFNKFWPADVHVMAKDILWFHVVYWPAMLKSVGIEPPKKIFAHGWWTVLNQKMGKSAGNAINIDQLIGYAGVDPARYFLMREIPFGQDGDFSYESLIERNNAELADKFGNLISRVSTLAEKYGIEKTSNSLLKKLKLSEIEKDMQNLALDKALNEIFAFVDICNEYVQSKKPWETGDKKVLYELADSIKAVSILLFPFMPETCEKIAKTFSFKIEDVKNINKPLAVKKIKKSEILFKKIEVKPKAEVKETKMEEKTSKSNLINYEQFSKVDLRVATVLDVEDIAGADKLYKLSIDLGKEKRTILAGMKPYYKKEEIKGKQIIVVANLEPRKMKGLTSEGMLLAASNEDHTKVILLSPEKKIDNGSKIS